MVQAAHDLFVVNGYGATTIAAVAEAADVSIPTVYAGFAGGKAELLRYAIDFAIAGDDRPVPIRDRPTAVWVYRATSADELLSRYAVLMGEQAQRASPIYSVLVRAADAEPELAELLASREAQRLRAARRLAEAVRDRGGLPKGRSVATARDMIWVCNAPENYTMLVTRRGWSARRYVEWARTTLTRTLLDPAP
ncbi:MAG: TetR/AcrR family transcriptional regulator [Acidimicrobiales bacterium]